MDFFTIAALWLFGALLGVLAAQRRGFSVALGVLGGLLLGPLAFLMFWAKGNPKCPACQEFVKAQATVCKHCQHALTPTPAAPADSHTLVNDVLNGAIALVATVLVIVLATRALLP